MKQGRNLTDLATELQRQSQVKRDYLAPTRQLRAVMEPERFAIEMDLRDLGINQFPLTIVGHEQVREWSPLPAAYYNRLLAEAPGLLATNLNHWFQQSEDVRMVRTLDGHIRAFRSRHFRPLDNIDLAEAVLPILASRGVRVESCEVTEKRLYLKAVTERITWQVKVGDIVQAGLVISNSEVGCGAVAVDPMLFQLRCLNGAVAPVSGNGDGDGNIRKYHIGRNNADFFDRAAEFFKDETRKADDRAFFLKVRDVVEHALSETNFERLKALTQASTQRRIEAPVEKVIEVVQRRHHFSDAERSSILNHLAAGGDLTQWGLAAAITRASQDVKDYDGATDLERTGGQIITLGPHEWSVINETAKALPEKEAA